MMSHFYHYLRNTNIHEKIGFINALNKKKTTLSVYPQALVLLDCNIRLSNYFPDMRKVVDR
jgi:hypothetical protein